MGGGENAKTVARALCFPIFFLTAFGSIVHCTSNVCMTVRSYGYLCQDYKITTEDGYVLSLQRIPNDSAGPKQPVLLQHGVLVDGMVWVLSPKGLALALSDAGFDVWIVNSRGTRSSRAHTSLNADTDPNYWEWTWVELANFDLPATVDMINSITGQRVHFVGHSLGTLIMLAPLSQHKLAERVGAVALLAPIAHLKHITSKLLQIAANVYGDQLLGLLGGAEFSLESQSVQSLLSTICSGGVDCSNMLALLTGQNCCLNRTSLNTFMKYEPQPTSKRNIVHLVQMVRSGNIAMYDYGNRMSNIQKYGQPQPPAYDLSGVPADTPILLSHGGKDALSDVQDVNLLLGELGDHQKNKFTVHFIADYAHADFVMASNAGEELHGPLITFFRNNAS